VDWDPAAAHPRQPKKDAREQAVAVRWPPGGAPKPSRMIDRTSRDGSRPRDPLFAKPSVFTTTDNFTSNPCIPSAARGDARPPCEVPNLLG